MIQKPGIIAHRGASRTCRENTMDAFQRAVSDGADGIEFDLRLSADRKWVVHHNADALIGGVPARLSQLTLSEITQIPIGAGGERIPALSEFLGWAKSQPVSLMFDIKDADGVPELVDTVEVIGLTGRAGGPVRAVFSSFNRSVLHQLRQLRPQWQRALIVDDPRWSLTRKLLANWLLKTAVRTEMSALHLHQRWITPSIVVAAKSAGIRLAVWTVDDPARMGVLACLGVDSIITNDPLIGRQTIDQVHPEGSSETSIPIA